MLFFNCSVLTLLTKSLNILLVRDNAFNSIPTSNLIASNAILQVKNVFDEQFDITLNFDQLTESSITCENNYKDWYYWNKNRPQLEKNYAGYVLLSQCFPGSGWSVMNSLCNDQMNYAVIHYMDDDQFWPGLAHELGHMFGQPHVFENGYAGLMDYYPQLYDGIHQFKLGDQICAKVQDTIETDCWQTN